MHHTKKILFGCYLDKSHLEINSAIIIGMYLYIYSILEMLSVIRSRYRWVQKIVNARMLGPNFAWHLPVQYMSLKLYLQCW